MKYIGIVFGIFLFLFGNFTFAHGIEHSVFEGGVGVMVHYEDGNPLAEKSVVVYAPSSDDQPYQKGNTDKNGTFVFSPDAPGTWRIEVMDETGHGMIEEIEVTEQMVPEPGEHHDMATGQKILMGVSLIFGVTGIGFYFTEKKKTD